MRQQNDSFCVRPLLRHLKDSEDKFSSSGLFQSLGTIAHLDHLKERVAGAAMAPWMKLGKAKATPILTALTALTVADSDSAQGKSGLFAID
jgi:hypothetical protein